MKKTLTAALASVLALTACMIDSRPNAGEQPIDWHLASTQTHTQLTITNSDHQLGHAFVIDWVTPCLAIGTKDLPDYIATQTNHGWQIEAVAPADAQIAFSC